MKNTKVKIISTIVAILLATLLFCANSFAAVKINFGTISNGKGTITVEGNTNNDKIYYQAVSMTETQYNNIGQIEDQIDAAYDNYRSEFDPKNAEYQPLKDKVNNQTATQEEIARAQQLAQELETLTRQYEATRDSLNQRREDAFPKYNNSGWLEAVNGKFEVTNTTNYAKYYVLWAKVGDVTEKKRVKVNKTSNIEPTIQNWTMKVGDSWDLSGDDLSSINWNSDDPTIATITNKKINALKVGKTTIRGLKNVIEVIDIVVTVEATDENTTKLDIPSDAKGYNTHAYYYFSGNKSWDDAKAYCEKIGGHLVTITTQGEEEFVKSLLQDTSKAWIGAYKDGSWKWVTNEKWDYTDWNTNQPGNQERGIVTSTKWAALDNNSMETTGFVCEWDVTKQGEISPAPTDDSEDPTNPSNPSNPTDSEETNTTKEPEEQLIYRQDGIQDSTTNPKSTSGDNSIATKKIPQTGESIVALVAIVAVVGVSVVLFVNYRKNNK